MPAYGIPDFFTGEFWRDEAACKGMDQSIFFPERGESTDEAKRVCMGCPVKVDCAEYALTTKQEIGIWGGLSNRQRRSIKRGALTYG